MFRETQRIILFSLFVPIYLVFFNPKPKDNVLFLGVWQSQAFVCAAESFLSVLYRRWLRSSVIHEFTPSSTSLCSQLQTAS